MRRILILCSVLLLISACAMADIGMPNDHVYSIGTLGNYSMGISVMGLPNGNIVIKVYRDVCPNATYPNAITRMSAMTLKVTEIVPADPVQTGQPLHSPVVKTFTRSDWISSATMPFQGVPSYDYATGFTSECSWAVDAFQWRSYQYHNATWRIEATGTGYLQYGGTTDTLPLTVTKDIATNNLVVEDLSMPHYLTWQGSAGSPHPIVSFGHTASGDDVRDGGPLTATSGTVGIYSAATGSLVRTLTVPAFDTLPGTPITVDWDGRDSSGALAPRGFYSYDVTLQHVEKRWSFPNGDPYTWPNWRPYDCTTGTRNVAGVLAYDKDTDHRLSSNQISNVVITQPAGGGYDVNWTVSPGRIWNGRVDAFRRSDLSLVAQAQQAGSSQHLAIADDAYYFLVYGNDRGESSKDHYSRQILGRSYSVGLGAPTVTGPTSPCCQSNMAFTITFKDNVTGLTASGINVTGATKGALDTVNGSTYVLHVTATAGTVTCQVPAHSAQASNGYWNTVSNSASVTYAPGPTLATPTFSPTGGDATFPLDVTVTSDAGSVIHYTINGADPTVSDPGVASGGVIRLEHCSTLKARAFKDGCFTPSAVATADYMGQGQVTVAVNYYPWAIPLPMSYPQTRTQSVYHASELGGAGSIQALSWEVYQPSPGWLDNFVIRMKQTTVSSFYNSTFENTGWTTVYASGEYIDDSTGWRTFNLSTPFDYDGISNLMIDVSYNCYSAPSTDFTYINCSNHDVCRSRCLIEDGDAGDPLTWTDGWISTDSPNIKLDMTCERVAAPVITPAAGIVSTPFCVGMSCTTPGATIYYTTNGTEPTDQSTVYTGPVTFTTCPVTVKAVAYVPGLVRSNVTTSGFTNVGDVVIGEGQSAWYMPFYTYYNQKTRAQSIYLAREIGSSCAISALSLDVYDIPPASNFKIRMKQTPLAEFTSGAFDSSGWTTVYQGSPTLTAGWNTFTFSAPFNYAVGSNLMVDYSVDNATYFETYGTVNSSYPGGYRSIVNYGNDGDPLAWTDGWQDSTVPNVKLHCQSTGDAATPSISPSSGTFDTPQMVTITPVTGAEIRYTTNGAEPTSSSTLYTGPFEVSATATVKAKAFRGPCISGATAAEAYSFKVATPYLSPATGTYDNVIAVGMYTNTPDASIHYTTDGSTPTLSSPVYDSANPPIIHPTAASNPVVTVKAKAFRSLWTESDLVTETYTFKVGTPYFNYGSGTYDQADALSVEIYDSTTDATIRYTTDGTDPTATSPIYTTPILVDHSMTIKAKAFKTYFEDSDIAEAVYELSAQPLVFTPDAGSYYEPLNVLITTPSEGVDIRYTLNGTEPTLSSAAYPAGGVPITTSPMTLKARGFRHGWAVTPIKSADYSLIVATPALAKVNCTTVRVTCSTTGATIHYTLNGVDPTPSDPVVVSGNTITVSGCVTVKAKAWKTGWVPSGVRSAYFCDCEFKAVEIFWAIDCTGSMGEDGGVNHRAHQSIEAFVNSLSSCLGNIPLAGGGVKFNEPTECSGMDSILLSTQFQSISNGWNPSSFFGWLLNGYSPCGGDGEELQLHALHYAAQDMSTRASSYAKKYIVLVTDSPYHENYDPLPDLDKTATISELTATGIPVYISQWDENYISYYTDLTCNGGEIDPVNPNGDDTPGNYRYPFANLRARILSDMGITCP